MKQPTQPVIRTDAEVKFQPNLIIPLLVEWAGGFRAVMERLNTAEFNTITAEDRSQFLQLLGYSVEHLAALGHDVGDAQAAAARLQRRSLDRLDPAETQIADLQQALSNVANIAASVERLLIGDNAPGWTSVCAIHHIANIVLGKGIEVDTTDVAQLWVKDSGSTVEATALAQDAESMFALVKTAAEFLRSLPPEYRDRMGNVPFLATVKCMADLGVNGDTLTKQDAEFRAFLKLVYSEGENDNDNFK